MFSAGLVGAEIGGDQDDLDRPQEASFSLPISQAPPMPKGLPRQDGVDDVEVCNCLELHDDLVAGEDHNERREGSNAVAADGCFEAELGKILEDARSKIVAAFASERDHQPFRELGRGNASVGKELDAGPAPSEVPLLPSSREVQMVVAGEVDWACRASSLKDGSQAGPTLIGPGELSCEVTAKAFETNVKPRLKRQSFMRQRSPWLGDLGIDRQRSPWAREASPERRRSSWASHISMGADQRSPWSTDRNIDRQKSPGAMDFLAEQSKLRQILNSMHSSPVSETRFQDNSGRDARACWRKARDLVKHPAFEAVMSTFIILNLVTIGVNADVERDWVGWERVDLVFGLIFTVEVFLKWMSYGVCYFFRSAPYFFLNWLDFILILLHFADIIVSLMSIDSDDSSKFLISVMRTLRLVRVARVLRLVRLPIFNELSMMLDGAQGGLRTLMWSQVLVALFLYVVALIFRVLLGGSDPAGSAQYFSSLSQSYFTVFRCLIGNDCNDTMGRPIFVSISNEHGWQFAVIYCCASVLMTFGLFNVIVGIYVENTVAAARCNNNRLKQERLTNKRIFEAKVYQLVEFVLQSGIATGGVTQSLKDTPFMDLKTISLTWDMLETLRMEAGFRDILHDLDVADEEQIDLFDTLDVNGSGEVDLEELVQAIAKLRGDARRSDIVSVGLMVRNLQVAMSQLEVLVKGGSPKASEASTCPTEKSTSFTRDSGLIGAEMIAACSEKFAACQV